MISTIDSRSAKNTAAESLKTVTSLAITAQQARADETLSLIRRGDESVRKQSYYQRIDSMQQPKVKARLEADGSSPETGTPEQFAAFLAADVKHWAAQVKAFGIKPE